MPPAQARCMAVSFLHRGLFFTISFPTAVYNLPTNRYNEGVSFLQSMEGGEALAFFGYVLPTQSASRWVFSQGLPAGIQAADHRCGDDAVFFGGRLLEGADLHRGSDEPPVLTEEQAQIRDALARVSGDGEIKIPLSAERRIPFFLYLLRHRRRRRGGGDGLLSKRLQGGGHLDQHPRQQNGEWVSVCETPAPDSTANIDFVSLSS